jgi:hypothetical protein
MIGSVPLDEFSYGLDLSGADPASLNDALRAVTLDVMSDPVRMGTIVTGLMFAQQGVAMNALRRMQGENPPPAVDVQGDKRFTDPAWTSNPFLISMVEEYLLRRQYAQQLVESSRLPEATKRKARFAMNMMMDALAPSNLPGSTPRSSNRRWIRVAQAWSRARSSFSTTCRTTAAIRSKSIPRLLPWVKISRPRPVKLSFATS